jgi:hypothetical protein
MLSASPAADAAPSSPELSTSDTRLAGPGADISVTIPTGWHQIPSSQPGTPLMVYPATCADLKLRCASAFALIGSGQEFSARSVAELLERRLAHTPGVHGVTVTSEGPTQVAGRTGYFVRFTGSNVAHVKIQAECAAVQTGTARISIVFVGVSNRADAPPASDLDQIVDSTQLSRQPQPVPRTVLIPASDTVRAERPSPLPRMGGSWAPPR